MLGGRAAEEVIVGDLSTGASNDLERSTETARQMICRYGMSEHLGPLTYGKPAASRFLDSPVSFGDDRNFSDETARIIDHEVKTLVETQYARARSILEARRDKLMAIAERLLVVETMERPELERLAGLSERAPA
jgi:cell division protease FtsH